MVTKDYRTPLDMILKISELTEDYETLCTMIECINNWLANGESEKAKEISGMSLQEFKWRNAE